MKGTLYKPASSSWKRLRGAFTLVELLVSITVLSVLMLVMAQLLGKTQSVWSSASAKVSQFREARRAFDRIVRNLSQATLNPYLQYVYSGADPRVPPPVNTLSTPPSGYARYSELNFVTGRATELLGAAGGLAGSAVFFQAPLGNTDLANLSAPTALNPIGYYVAFSSDQKYRPNFLGNSNVGVRERFRLYEYRAPSETNRVYETNARDTQARTGIARPGWFDDYATEGRSHPVSDNIILMVIAPKSVAAAGGANPYAIADRFTYNTWANGLRVVQAPQDYQLPPMVEVFLVAIDEVSADRAEKNGRMETTLSFGSLFTTASPDRIREDMVKVEEVLNQERMNYRIFNTTVQLKNSKW